MVISKLTGATNQQLRSLTSLQRSYLWMVLVQVQLVE
jgi:hypothetical protein